MSSKNTLDGDLIEWSKSGVFDLIVHGCNCFCIMGAGIAKLIKHEFPEAYEADQRTVKGDRSKLGDFSVGRHLLPNKELLIVNAYTQFDYRGTGLKVDYDAVRQVFRKIKTNYSGLEMGYPRIGAGLGGGDWSIIRTIIEEELSGENHTFVQFVK